MCVRLCLQFPHNQHICPLPVWVSVVRTCTGGGKIVAWNSCMLLTVPVKGKWTLLSASSLNKLVLCYSLGYVEKDLNDGTQNSRPYTIPIFPVNRPVPTFSAPTRIFFSQKFENHTEIKAIHYTVKISLEKIWSVNYKDIWNIGTLKWTKITCFALIYY